MISRQRAVMTAQHAPDSWLHASAFGANQTASKKAQLANRGTSQSRNARHAREMTASYHVANIRLATAATVPAISTPVIRGPATLALMSPSSDNHLPFISKPLRAIE